MLESYTSYGAFSSDLEQAGFEEAVKYLSGCFERAARANFGDGRGKSTSICNPADETELQDVKTRFEELLWNSSDKWDLMDPYAMLEIACQWVDANQCGDVSVWKRFLAEQ